MATSKKNTQPTALQLASGLPISVKEARKVLGEEASNLDDDSVTTFILGVTELVHQVLLLTDDDGQYNG